MSDEAVFAICLLLAYWVPTVVALVRHHHQKGAVIVVNLLLGWTFVGWVAALAMACSATRQPA